jgi:hypothetical protein
VAGWLAVPILVAFTLLIGAGMLWVASWPAPVAAVKALRMNYTRRGAVHWLRHRHMDGETGWAKIRRDPEAVIRDQHRLAEGMFG